MRANSAEVFLPSFLQEALVSGSGMGRDVHSSMLSVQHFLCRPQRRPPSKGALKDDFREAVVEYDMPEPFKLEEYVNY